MVPTGKTVVIDYQTGNLNSVCKALRAAGAEVVVATGPAALHGAARIVLPGVGHFAATSRLFDSGLAEALRERIEAQIPFLGICVGLQWLFAGSTEAPETPGLEIFPGLCDRFPASVKSPHVGWNSLDQVAPSRLLRDIAPSSYVYFTHSYSAPRVNATTSVTFYGDQFSAVVERGNCMAVQFHPEKSGDVGLKILRNFVEIGPC